MADAAKSDAPSAVRLSARPSADALRDAGLTFLIAFALFGPLVGLRADTVNNALQISTHFGTALGLSAAVAGVRFAADLLFWRRAEDGDSIASAIPGLAFLWRGVPAFLFVLGGALYLSPALRLAIAAWANGLAWWVGSIADLLTFACMAGFIAVTAMIVIRAARIALASRHAPAAKQPSASGPTARPSPAALRPLSPARGEGSNGVPSPHPHQLANAETPEVASSPRRACAGEGQGERGDRWESRESLPSLAARFSEGFAREFPLALIAIALALPFLIAGPSQRYAIDTATVILIYIMLGWGLNVVVGLAGLLDLGYVAFYAVGAYTYALIATVFGWSFWACLPVAGVLAALWGITLGFPVLRLRGDYLAIVTMAFGEIIRIVLLNWQSLTGGANGINRIPKPTFFGLSFDRSGPSTFHGFFGLDFSPVHRIVFLYYVILCLALLTNFITLRLRRLPIGRAWEALREDEIACRSVGINTVITKLTAFAIGAMFGGLAGAFFSARQGFISPESFTFMESALVLAIVVLGGLGSQLGVVIAAVVLVGGLERFRDLQDYRMLIFGLAMVAVMIWRPRGLLSGRTPSVFLHEAKDISAAHVKEGRG